MAQGVVRLTLRVLGLVKPISLKTLLSAFMEKISINKKVYFYQGITPPHGPGVAPQLRETLVAEVPGGGGVRRRRVAEMTLWKNNLVFCSHFNFVCEAGVSACE
jgi:hypothetical protein